MEYLEFTRQIRQAVQDRCGDGMRVSVGRIMKNNRNLMDTLTIMKQGGNMSPAFYISQLYEEYRRGMTVDAIAEYVMAYYRQKGQGGRVDFSFYRDFRRVKDRIACRLINYEKNRELLASVPHRRYMDLAVVYYCRIDRQVLDSEAFGRGSILIQNAHMAQWKVTPEELHDLAVINTIRQLPYELISLEDMIRDTLEIAGGQGEQKRSIMYVLTNTEKWYGAVNIIFDSVLEAIGEKLRSDFYVLPSSIHECMIVPVTEEIKGVELRRMVREINADYVAEEEILGDSIYLYDREAHLLICQGNEKTEQKCASDA